MWVRLVMSFFERSEIENGMALWWGAGEEEVVVVVVEKGFRREAVIGAFDGDGWIGAGLGGGGWVLGDFFSC